MNKKGLYSAILSALLFGMSPVACKAIVGQMPASLLAGLLYAGSAVGLTGIVLLKPAREYGALRSLSLRQWLDLAGAIGAGGIAAPLFLAYGIRNGTAAEVSLLLNFESVATTLIAWLVFHEHIGPRVWMGKALIVAASVIVILAGSEGLRPSIPGLSVLAACLFWGVDNNLTRELETLSASLLACIKGWCAGAFNVLLFYLLFRSPVTPFQVAGVLIIGALSIGVSLVLFIHALREIGAARTSTWFASGPFIGTILAVVVLGEHPPRQYWLAALVMVSGMAFLYREVHKHQHRHEQQAHAHPHDHDEHHQHTHEHEEPGGIHAHFHEHSPITHTHPHWPDIHHHHGH
jgi:drug/metabolite transporter (DMT)-like permease